jgi:hypothetical protein
MQTLTVWIPVLIAATVVQHFVPGIIGIWLSVMVLIIALDTLHGSTWTSWWNLAANAAGGLGIGLLIQYQMAHESEAARSVWTLVMAMLFGGAQALLVYRWIERSRHQSLRPQ